MENRQKLDICLSDWEDQMVEDFCVKYDLPDSVVLDIGVSFLYNELQAGFAGKPCMMSSIAMPQGKE